MATDVKQITASSTSSSARTSVDCAHWRHCGVIGGGCCAHPEQPYGEHPSRGVCRQACAQRKPVDAVPDQAPSTSTVNRYARAATRAAHGARSVAKTSLGIDRASDELIEARLNICRQCPGNHAVWKNGDVHTCGPMLASMKGEGRGACGCVLRKKARDLKERCPLDYWPEPVTD